MSGAVTPAREAQVLDIRDLHVCFDTNDGEVHAVRGVTCQVARGECLGVVGESGSGKSQTFLAAMGLLASNARVEGQVVHKGTDLLSLDARQFDQVRGDRIAMIFQNPLTSLTPHMTIGEQLREGLIAHRGLSRRDARKRCLDWLERVHLPEPARHIDQYPHELSGGMRQRVMIAQAMLCEPDLLIADEPTTALDVTIQAEILDLMDELRRDIGTAIVLVTHDMGVVARLCDRVQVMRSGTYVEAGLVDAVFHAPAHAYTRQLLDAVPRIDARAPLLPEPISEPMSEPMSERLIGGHRRDDVAGSAPVLEAHDVAVRFRLPGGLFQKPRELRAVDGIGLQVAAGETLGIVGESGSGKSTLARALLGLIPIDAGEVSWLGRSLSGMQSAELRAARGDFSIVFQDPLASLDPSMTIGDSIAEPLRVAEPRLSRRERRDRVQATLERVGLEAGFVNRYPHELSGGQNQRVGIARAIITRPRLVICDEAVSALDVSVQARILDLLADLQRDLGLALLFISHDLSVVRQISHRVLVMYLGTVIELAPCNTLFDDPRHPYTRQLLSTVPVPDPRLERGRERLRLRPSGAHPISREAQLRFLPSRLAAAGTASTDSVGSNGDMMKAAATNSRHGATDELALPKLEEVGPDHFVAEHDPLETLLVEVVR